VVAETPVRSGRRDREQAFISGKCVAARTRRGCCLERNWLTIFKLIGRVRAICTTVGRLGKSLDKLSCRVWRTAGGNCCRCGRRGIRGSTEWGKNRVASGKNNKLTRVGVWGGGGGGGGGGCGGGVGGGV